MNKLEELFSLKGKTLLVTGGARGIGRCVAEAAAGAGADIVLVDVLEELVQKSAREIADKCGVKTAAYRCDVTDPDQVDGLLNGAAKRSGISSCFSITPVSASTRTLSRWHMQTGSG